MEHRIIPGMAASARSRRADDGYQQTRERGLAVLNSPVLNKGTAFPASERKALGLTGLLPPEISSLETQVRRSYIQYERLPDALGKNIFLTALHDRNEVLFFRLFSEHLREMIPIVNDLTVGMAIENYHHECRRPRGVYLSIDHPESIEESFANLGAGADDIDLIVATDAEKILGIGDWGVGGIEVSIGKLAIYTAAGGVDPARAIPVMLDVGTNRESLMGNPLYIGNRHRRIQGEQYDAFIESYVATVTRLFPHALIQWEDFAPSNGRRILEKYRGRYCTFNDDMQGTGAITLAAAISAARVCGVPMRHQKVVVFGAGTAGIGIADKIRNAMVLEGLPNKEATERFWCVDQNGLLVEGMSEEPRDYQAGYVRSEAETRGWKRGKSGIGLAEVVHRVQPTMLIGASDAPGSFTEDIVREMAAHTPRPVIFALSHPHANAEAEPSDLIAWTDGRVLVATGTPSPPVTWKGTTHVIAQISNALLYPGLALGVIVSRAARISDGMFASAASAVSSLVTVKQTGAALLPQIEDLRTVSVTVAVAVAETAAREGLSRVRLHDVVQQVHDAMWQPAYRRIEAI
jgi:malate dehydrogenase (oxaloacetate-decarboxylating)